MAANFLSHAVTVIEDITPGQFEMLPFYERERLLELHAFAEYALTQAATALSSWGVEVATRLLADIPQLIEAADSEPTSALVSKTAKKVSRDGYVYLIQSPTSFYKIGRTRDPNNRLKTFTVKLPFEVEYACVIQTADMYTLEAELHDLFGSKRVNGEWFALDAADVAYIKGLAK